MPGAPQPARRAVASTPKKIFEWAGLMETTRVTEPLGRDSLPPPLKVSAKIRRFSPGPGILRAAAKSDEPEWAAS
jgi:hypothetical protein